MGADVFGHVPLWSPQRSYQWLPQRSYQCLPQRSYQYQCGTRCIRALRNNKRIVNSDEPTLHGVVLQKKCSSQCGSGQRKRGGLWRLRAGDSLNMLALRGSLVALVLVGARSCDRLFLVEVGGKKMFTRSLFFLIDVNASNYLCFDA